MKFPPFYFNHEILSHPYVGIVINLKNESKIKNSQN